LYVEATQLRYHRAGVDLTHVAISVGLLQLADVQAPRAVDDFLRGLAAPRHSKRAAGGRAGRPRPGTSAALVRDGDTRIVRHDPGVNREDRLVRGAQPADLEDIPNCHATRKHLSMFSHRARIISDPLMFQRCGASSRRTSLASDRDATGAIR